MPRLSLPLLCALAVAGHVHDARAKRPSVTPSKSASSGTPPPTSQSATPPPPVKSTKATHAGKNTATKTVAAKLGTLVSEQRIVVPCYALVPFKASEAEHWRRGWEYCFSAKPNTKIVLAYPLHFPAVKGRIYLRKLECNYSVAENTEMKIETKVWQASTGGIHMTKTHGDNKQGVHEFDDIEIDPKNRFDLYVELETKTSPGGDPDEFQGRIGDCKIDYMIINASPK